MDTGKHIQPIPEARLRAHLPVYAAVPCPKPVALRHTGLVYLAASPDSGYVAGSAHYLLVVCRQLCAVAAHSAYRYPENWQTAETLNPTGAVSA